LDEILIAEGDDATNGAWPLWHSAVALANLGHGVAAAERFSDLVDRFGNVQDPAVEGIVTDARARLLSADPLA
jgi:hypothetical protein